MCGTPLPTVGGGSFPTRCLLELEAAGMAEMVWPDSDSDVHTAEANC
jgi:hypothetical protein